MNLSVRRLICASYFDKRHPHQNLTVLPCLGRSLSCSVPPPSASHKTVGFHRQSAKCQSDKYCRKTDFRKHRIDLSAVSFRFFNLTVDCRNHIFPQHLIDKLILFVKLRLILRLKILLTVFQQLIIGGIIFLERTEIIRWKCFIELLSRISSLFEFLFFL